MGATTHHLLFASIGGAAESYLVAVLREEGYAVQLADGMQTVLQELDAQVDMLLLNLFALQDLEVVTAARARSSCAIIVLGPPRAAQMLINALERGADDYVQRPFRTDELLARIRARLRRISRSEPTNMQLGALRLNMRERSATVNGQPTELSSFEFLLLLTLAAHVGQHYRPAALLEQIWGARRVLDIDLLQSAVYRLRLLIERDPGAPEILCGDLRHGYWLNVRLREGM